MQFSFDTNINKIAAKVEANERLTFDEGVELYNTDDFVCAWETGGFDAAES